MAGGPSAPETLGVGQVKKKARRGSTKKRTWTTEKMQRGAERHNVRIVETSLKPQQRVTLSGFELTKFVSRVAAGRVPLGGPGDRNALPERRLEADGGPRLVFDENGKFVLFYSPEFWSEKTQDAMLARLDELVVHSPLVADTEKAGGDKRKGSGSHLRASSSYWSLYTHGIAQQNKHQLKPSPSLTSKGGVLAVESRRSYLRQRQVNDHKVNHMVKLLHPDLWRSLEDARDRLKEQPVSTSRWVTDWESLFPSFGLMENRLTSLHRDSNGAQYAADFLYLFGSFEGGDLHLPDLNLKLEWLPRAACMFDGRTFAHEVMEWSGTRRICMVHYLWKSSMSKLGITLPVRAPLESEISARLPPKEGTGLPSLVAGASAPEEWS